MTPANKTLKWRKSSYSCDSANCVEVAVTSTTTVAVRDSKNAAGPHLTFDRHTFKNFIKAVCAGRFDRRATFRKSPVNRRPVH